MDPDNFRCLQDWVRFLKSGSKILSDNITLFMKVKYLTFKFISNCLAKLFAVYLSTGCTCKFECFMKFLQDQVQHLFVNRMEMWIPAEGCWN